MSASGNLLIIEESGSDSGQTDSSSQKSSDFTKKDPSKTGSFHGASSNDASRYGGGSTVTSSFRSDGSSAGASNLDTDSSGDFTLTFTGVEAGIVAKFYEVDLLELAEKYGCLIEKKPSIGQPEVIIIKWIKHKDAFESSKRKIKRDIGKIERSTLVIREDQISEVKDFILDTWTDSKRLFYLEKSTCLVHVAGKSYEDNKQGIHQLEVKLGRKKVTSRKTPSYADTARSGLDSTNNQHTSRSGLYPNLSNSYNEKSSTSSNKRSVHASSGPIKYLLDESLNETLQFKIYKASIIRLDVDVIVNAANDTLMHGGGVARVIAEAAGYELEQECRNYIWKCGKIPVCKSYISNAGKLNFKGVIHSVGPQWYMYSDKEKLLEDLYVTVWNLLEVCDERQYSTVAMPAISAGIYGVPKEVCADMYVRAAIEYSRRNKMYPKEFHVVDVDEEILKLTRESYKRSQEDPEALKPANSLSTYYKYNPTKHWNQDKQHRGRGGRRQNRSFPSSDDSASQPGSTQGYGHSNRVHTPPGDKAGSYCASFKGSAGTSVKIERQQSEIIATGIIAEVYTINTNMKMKVYKGSIEKVTKVAALVSTVDKYGEPSGMVAKVLKTAGGYKYTQDIEKEKKKLVYDLRVCDAFVSKAGLLQPNSVIHVYLPRLSSHDDLTMFDRAMTNVLQNAEEKRINSIALPLLGTGGMQNKTWLLGKFASELVSTISNFCVNNPRHLLHEIHLVNNTTQVVEAINSAFSKLSQSLDQSGNTSMRNRPLPELPTGQSIKDNTVPHEDMDTDDSYDWLSEVKRPLPPTPREEKNNYEAGDNDDDDHYSTPFTVVVNKGAGSASMSGTTTSTSQENFNKYREQEKHFSSDDEGEGGQRTSQQDMMRASTKQSGNVEKSGNLNIFET